MIKRVFSFILAIYIGWIAAITPAHAVVPALVFAAEAVAPIVVHSVGRQAVINLGIAANDAIWASSIGSWVTAPLAIGVVSLLYHDGGSVEVQIKEGEPLTFAPTTMAYVWRVIETPGSWHAYSDIRLRDYANGHVEALDTAAERLSLHLAGTCTIPDGAYELLNVDATWGKSYVHCSVAGSNTTLIFTVHVTHSAQQVENLDGVRRVTYSDSVFRRDSSDPDWNNGPVPPDLWLPQTAVKWNVPSIDPDEIPEDYQVEFVGNDASAVIRSASTLDGVDWNIRTLKTDDARVPYEFTETVVNYTPEILPDVTTLLGLPGNPNPDTGTGTITFPSDYPREATQEEIRDIQRESLDLMKPTQSMDDPLVPNDMPDFGTAFNDLLGWSLPAHSSECPTGSFAWNGETYTMDSHCQLINDHWSALQAVMVVFWSLSALFVVLRA